MEMTDIDQYFRIAKKFGNDIFYAQAGGGNTSIKLGDKLYIKSSGSMLQEAARDKTSVLSLNDGSQLKESGFSHLKPSMEFGFHLDIRSKYVFHLHCLRTVLLSVVDKCNDLVKDIRDLGIDCEYLDYLTPGAELHNAIKALDIGSRQGVVILQNHGIIAFSDDISELETIVAAVGIVATAMLNRENYYFESPPLVKKSAQQAEYTSFILDHDIDVSALFNFRDFMYTPDHVVFLIDKVSWTPIHSYKQIDMDKRDYVYFTDKGEVIFPNISSSLFEMVWSLLFMIRGLMQMEHIKSHRLLSVHESRKLLKMPEEKYRKLLALEKGL